MQMAAQPAPASPLAWDRFARLVSGPERRWPSCDYAFWWTSEASCFVAGITALATGAITI